MTVGSKAVVVKEKGTKHPKGTRVKVVFMVDQNKYPEDDKPYWCQAEEGQTCYWYSQEELKEC